MKKTKITSTVLVFVQFVLIFIIGAYSSIYGNIFTNSLMFSGIALGLWAIITMKFDVNIFPDVRNKQRLFVRGPYKYIRHPMYLAVLMTTFAWVLNRFNLVSIVLWLILFSDLLIKIKYEEKLLTTYFAKYSDYKNKIKALIPFVW